MFREFESLNLIYYDMCELDGIKPRNDKMIFYHIYWWLWIMKNKIDMLDMFSFFNENWNLCWKEYPSLWTKIQIKKFWRKYNPTCLIFWTWDCLTYVWISNPGELNSLVEPMNVYSLGML